MAESQKETSRVNELRRYDLVAFGHFGDDFGNFTHVLKKKSLVFRARYPTF